MIFTPFRVDAHDGTAAAFGSVPAWRFGGAKRCFHLTTETVLYEAETAETPG